MSRQEWKTKRRRHACLAAVALVSAVGVVTTTKSSAGELFRGDERHPRRRLASSDEGAGTCQGVDPAALDAVLLGNCTKARALEKFWQRRGALVYWHVQKTGGTTVCRLAMREGLYEERFLDGYEGGKREALRQIEGDNCRFGYVNVTACMMFHKPPMGSPKPCQLDPADEATWPTQARSGRHFFAMEPEGHEDWPFNWYLREWFHNPGSLFWRLWPHVVSVRDPAERFLSDFKQRRFLEICARVRLDFERCVTAMLGPLEPLAEAFRRAGYNGEAVAYTVRERLLGDALAMHLGGSGGAAGAAVAKTNLRKMALILDFKARSEASAFLVQKVLRFQEGEPDHAAARIQQTRTFQEKYPELYGKVRERLAADFEVWEYALELLDGHSQRLGFVPLPPEEASQGGR